MRNPLAGGRDCTSRPAKAKGTRPLSGTPSSITASTPFDPKEGIVASSGAPTHQCTASVWSVAVRYGARDDRLVAITPACAKVPGWSTSNASSRSVISTSLSPNSIASRSLRGWYVKVNRLLRFTLHSCSVLTTRWFDVALQNLPVVFAVDRAGVVGGDGLTHAGNYDIATHAVYQTWSS